MNVSDKTLWLTRTGALIAVLIVWQMFMGTATGNNQIIVGSGVNLILAISVMTGGLWSGVAVGMLSPVFARFLGIGPLWAIVPVIMVGNFAFVVLWHFIGNAKIGTKELYAHGLAAFVAAFVKFLVILIGSVYIVVPMLSDNLTAQQANGILAAFGGTTQLVTASIGGAVACIMLPFLKNALEKK